LATCHWPGYPYRLGDVPLAAVEIELSITRGREQLERLLAKLPCAA
jgi:hypothetical protein